MKNYIRDLYSAMDWADRHSKKEYNHRLSITPEKSYDINTVVKAIAKDFTEFMGNSDELPGKCFIKTRELSYVLYGLRIKHMVTIGDVQLSDKLYIGLSKQQLKQDLKEGYQIEYNKQGVPTGKLANAHAWITLDNGSVIDATILASQNRLKDNYSTLSFEDAIYYSGKENCPEINHIPLMTGFGYYVQTLTHELDGYFNEYCQWYNDFRVHGF